ncbi:hypothetical protein, partial [Pectobacterium versatile]|uniref:hypothetical protein n=1 Tax=Pectobacterium versatile TaxID=2488639 RepID=UPI00208E1793
TGNGREFCSAGAEGETLPKSGKKEAATLRVTATFKSLTDKHYASEHPFFFVYRSDKRMTHIDISCWFWKGIKFFNDAVFEDNFSNKQ